MSFSSTQEPTGLHLPHAFRRVLVASTLDECGARAALRATLLPLASSARVSVLHVVSPWRERHASRTSVREVRSEIERVVAAAARVAPVAGNDVPDVVPLVSEGWPATEIVRAAWREGAELIVMGPPRSRLVGAGGATISRVMRRADLPLLVVRTEPRSSYRHVLCAVDTSATTVDTVALAVRFSSGTAHRLTLFHAYHVPFEPWLGSRAQEIENEALEHVRALASAIGEAVGDVRAEVRPGEPALEILRSAAHGCVDLIVIGTHGRAGLSHAIRGSVAEWVIASAPFDVAIARPHRYTVER